MTTTPDAYAERDDGRATVLTFSLEGTRYCVDVDRVAAAVGVGDWQALEAAPDPWHAGTLSLDGERVIVVDLARAFGSPTATPDRPAEPRLLVFEPTDRGRRGWLVDDVGVTRTVDRSALERAGGRTRFVRGWVELDGDRLLWLDDGEING